MVNTRMEFKIGALICLSHAMLSKTIKICMILLDLDYTIILKLFVNF